MQDKLFQARLVTYLTWWSYQCWQWMASGEVVLVCVCIVHSLHPSSACNHSTSHDHNCPPTFSGDQSHSLVYTPDTDQYSHLQQTKLQSIHQIRSMSSGALYLEWSKGCKYYCPCWPYCSQTDQYHVWDCVRMAHWCQWQCSQEYVQHLCWDEGAREMLGHSSLLTWIYDQNPACHQVWSLSWTFSALGTHSAAPLWFSATSQLAGNVTE